MTPLYCLAVILTVPRYQAPSLREFLERYLTYRVFCGISVVVSNHRILQRVESMLTNSDFTASRWSSIFRTML
jgi:hypothetical protein